MSGLPVHFRSFNVSARAGAVIDASADTVAESITAPANVRHSFVFMDFASKQAR
jgi:hypothetical protein